MSNKSITIGIANSNIAEVKNELESLLNIKFDEHESSYLGVYYKSKISGGDEFELSNNFVDGDWSEPEYKDYNLILRFYGINNPEQVTSTILNKVNNTVLIKVLETKTREYLRVYDFVDGQFVLIREKSLKKE